MSSGVSTQKLATLSLGSVVLTMLTIVGGAPFMRVLRKSFGSKMFWFVGVLATLTLWFSGFLPFSVYVATVWMTLGVFTELESRGVRWTIASALGVFSGFLVSGLGLLEIFLSQGIRTLEEAKEAAHQFAQSIQSMLPEAQFDATAFAQLAPSTVVITLIIAITLGVVLEKRVAFWLGIPSEKVVTQVKLFAFKNPDLLVWISMTSFLVTVLFDQSQQVAVIGENILRISMVLYFLQGFAILEVFFVSTKAGFVTRILSYLLLVGPFLSVVGFADFWIDFRRRLFTLKLSAKSN